MPEASLLADTPPRYDDWRDEYAPIVVGEVSWRAYALQKVCNSLRFAVDGAWDRLEPDGGYGEVSLVTVKAVQRHLGLVADGVVGQKTQGALLGFVGERVEALRPTLPRGLTKGQILSEAGEQLGCVNWSSPGGVDCGPLQWRLLGPPFSRSKLIFAFDPVTAAVAAMDKIAADALKYFGYAGVRNRADRSEFAWRLGALAHNAPAFATDIALDGYLYNPGANGWMPGATFPDGEPVVTRLDCLQFYALGGPHGEGRVTRFVKTWPKIG